MVSNNHIFTLLLQVALVLAFATFLMLVVHSSAYAQQYYECQVSVKTVMRDDVACRDYVNLLHRCQIYDKNYSGSGVPNFCYGSCVNRSDIPRVCADVIVQPSNNPEAHEARVRDDAIEEGKNKIKEQTGIDVDQFRGTPFEEEVRERLEGVENEINTDDGVDASEVNYIVGEIVSVIKDIVDEGIGYIISGTREKIGDIEDNIKENVPLIGDGDELTEEDFEDHSIEATGFNEYRSEKWPDENGTKIAKVVDPYGIERYTSDGKHFYDNAYDAAHSGEGLSNIANNVKDAWSDFVDVFSFRTKLEDKDKELQREIAREVLDDAKSQREKDVEKAYEKLSSKVNVPRFGDVPAKAVIEVAKEASATDFAGGALLYIEQRREGKSPATIRENFSEELAEGYGTFREGVSLSTTNEHAPAVLFARYEETYQRYLLAKEFGREE